MTQEYTSKQYEQDLLVSNLVEGNGIDVEHIYGDIDRKIALLKEIGYVNLRIGSNQDKSPFRKIEECDDSRISIVVKTRYDLARRRLEEYESGERVIKSEEGSLEKLSKSAVETPKPVRTEQRDLFPGMFGHSHTDDGSLEY